MTVQETINNAVSWAVSIANDDTHGYDMDRQKGDYDCSSLIIEAYSQASVPVKSNGATYTGNMKKAFLKSGFVEVPLSFRRKGDVLLNELHHVAMMVDSYNLVHASINEKGTTKGGKVGDQTGKEICIRAYYVYPKGGWDCCLRYVGLVPEPRYDKNVKVRLLKRGCIGEDVKTIQALLNIKNNANLDCDSEFGSLTEQAVKNYQQKHNLEVDGIVGENTWSSLLND